MFTTRDRINSTVMVDKITGKAAYRCEYDSYSPLFSKQPLDLYDIGEVYRVPRIMKGFPSYEEYQYPLYDEEMPCLSFYCDSKSWALDDDGWYTEMDKTGKGTSDDPWRNLSYALFKISEFLGDNGKCPGKMCSFDYNKKCIVVHVTGVVDYPVTSHSLGYGNYALSRDRLSYSKQCSLNSVQWKYIHNIPIFIVGDSANKPSIILKKGYRPLCMRPITGADYFMYGEFFLDNFNIVTESDYLEYFFILGLRDCQISYNNQEDYDSFGGLHLTCTSSFEGDWRAIVTDITAVDTDVVIVGFDAITNVTSNAAIQLKADSESTYNPRYVLNIQSTLHSNNISENVIEVAGAIVRDVNFTTGYIKCSRGYYSSYVIHYIYENLTASRLFLQGHYPSKNDSVAYNIVYKEDVEFGGIKNISNVAQSDASIYGNIIIRNCSFVSNVFCFVSDGNHGVVNSHMRFLDCHDSKLSNIHASNLDFSSCECTDNIDVSAIATIDCYGSVLKDINCENRLRCENGSALYNCNAKECFISYGSNNVYNSAYDLLSGYGYYEGDGIANVYNCVIKDVQLDYYVERYEPRRYESRFSLYECAIHGHCVGGNYYLCSISADKPIAMLGGFYDSIVTANMVSNTGMVGDWCCYAGTLKGSVYLGVNDPSRYYARLYWIFVRLPNSSFDLKISYKFNLKTRDLSLNEDGDYPLYDNTQGYYINVEQCELLGSNFVNCNSILCNRDVAQWNNNDDKWEFYTGCE